MGRFVGVGQVTVDLVDIDRFRLKGEGRDFLVSLLHLHLGIVEGFFIDAGGRPGLKSLQVKPGLAKTVRQKARRKHPIGTAVILHLSHKDFAVEVRSGADDAGLARVGRAGAHLHPSDFVILNDELCRFLLAEG